jgi:hypothetical protein
MNRALKTLTTSALAFILSASALASTNQTAHAALMGPGINLLSNPGHEHPGAYFDGRGELNVSWGWFPYWEEPPEGVDQRDPFFRTPEFRPVFAHEYPYRVNSGGGSDRYFNFFALNKKAGIMQYVANVPYGARIRFTSWLELWSSNDNFNPPSSTNDGNLKVRVCIDQDGGPRDMTDPNLVCSDWAQPYDKWEQLSVDGLAKNNVVNVLIWSSADIPVEHNDIYADDSCFEILPAAGAPGICKGQGFVPTGPGVVPAPPEAASIKSQDTAATARPKSPAPVLAAVLVPTVKTPAAAVNTRGGLNIREKPSQKAKVVASARRGDVLPVLGKSQDGKWFQVQGKKAKGWVLASLLKTNAAARSVPVVK